MKARIKATGKIVEVKSKVISSAITGEYLLKYVDQETGVSYFEEELFFPKDLADDPDYWTRLEHQAAIAAMQAIISKQTVGYKLNTITDLCCNIAHALVEKYKEKEERK